MKTEIRPTPIYGKGVFALQDFDQGDTVVNAKFVARNIPNDVHAVQTSLDEFVRFDALRSSVNHSCNPNCGIAINKEGAHDLVAIKPIAMDDHITYDYAMENYVVDNFPPACGCGSHNCRTVITGWRDLPGDLKKAYSPYAAPYLLKMEG